MRHLDYVKPQVYWVAAHNPVEQLNRAVAEWRQVTDKPIIPDGAAYTERRESYRMPDGSLWLPTETDLAAFHNRCLVLGLNGYTLWEWANAGQYSLLPAIGNLRWKPKQDGQPPVPDPEPVELPANALERLWYGAHQAGWDAAGWL